MFIISQNFFLIFFFGKKNWNPAKIRQIFFQPEPEPEPDFEAGNPAGAGFSRISGRFLLPLLEI